jgi:hypothetical protein
MYRPSKLNLIGAVSAAAVLVLAATIGTFAAPAHAVSQSIDQRVQQGSNTQTGLLNLGNTAVQVGANLQCLIAALCVG